MLGKLVKERRLQLGLTQEEVAQIAGVVRERISVIERSLTDVTVGDDTLYGLAKALQVEPHILVGKAPPKPMHVLEIAIVGFVPCGTPFPSDQERRGYLPLAAARVEGHRQDSLYAVEASGNSLIGDDIHDGDYLIVDRQGEFVNGHIYIVLLGNEVVARHCHFEGKRVKLVASSGEYQDIEASHLVLLGRVILSGKWQEH